MKVGDLVRYRGVLGVIVRRCTAKWAERGDVIVLWADEVEPTLENGEFLEDKGLRCKKN